MATGESEPAMTSHTFQLLSDQEILDMKRSQGIVSPRKLKCDKKFPCTSCVRRGRADICPTGRLYAIFCRFFQSPRVIRAEPLELSSTILTMGDRIRQLETAVAEAHGEESESPHPLLREDLLAIKRSTELPTFSPDPTPAQLADTFGTLAMSASGTSRYFGPTAGPAAQGSAGGDRAEFATTFADITESFPFDPPSSTSWDPISCRETLLAHLPDELRAWTLFDIYVNKASWYGTPLMADELHELLAEVYDSNQHLNPDAPELSAHALAVVFLAFALAALADLSLPAYNVQADTYFDLARTALALEPVFGSTDLHTVQALIMAGLYHVTGGPRYSIDSSWSLGAMACSLAQTVHREGAHTGFDNKTAQRRRAMFWEVYSLDTYQAISFARPPTIPLADITCEFPADTEQTMDNEGRTIPGCTWSSSHSKITAPMAQVYTSATPPTYEEVLDLDRRLRQFIESAPFAHYRKGPTFLAYLRSALIPRFCGDLMLYIHRSSFVQALKDSPHNPLESPYAASFLAAYRGASSIIKADRRSFALFPDEFHRWWPIWKSLFIVGSIVAKCPTFEIAPTAFAELHAAVALVEQGATHSFLAQGSVLVLQRLRNKAAAVYAEVHPLAIRPNPNPNPAELANEEDFESLGGSRAFLPQTRSQNHNHYHNRNNPTLSMPTLISGLMPASSTPDSWQPDIPDSAYTGFAFDSLMGSAHRPPAPLSDSLSLEAYLSSVEMLPNTNSSYPDAVPQADWATFVSSLQ
ncbi:hypothetical protein C8R44DRAFT_759889 [Mycena epipterygia]|nr:hypothetical protein C8R44DRAFT_759889 [Mycena epipterygia]